MTDPESNDSSDASDAADVPEAPGPDGGEDDTGELPAEVVDEAERLTRLERTVPDEKEARAHADRRDDLLAEHDFTARVREDDGDDVLVLHPAEWLEDGVIRTDQVEDTSRAVELPLEGAGDPDDWDEVDAHNRELVAEVRERHGDVHGDNAAALADFVGNHYAKPIESLTAAELEEFRSEYFVRNAWPSEKQRDVIAESIELLYETAGEPVP
ncbi:rnhA operon protein [Halobiforma lacisalsi AJ5]|uniref:RnhA operon protein n=1 Tax=Natronobacterium lacisalsi AJ5 TaxID=358396 RepID=M0L3S6_NATLA|nr:hypothetical protein [Halobiforma lacisalsi]APW98251.1 rnhA operon protein [Halobiforma lacisalsi AJ5]EMA28237.1 hypothetical protein C445_19398 [Halobiforma lacisalsi AJ5]